MYDKEEELNDREKIRTYSKRLVTTLSIILGLGYIATLLFRISGLGLYFSIVGTVLSIVSFALNMWSLNDYFKMQDLDKKTDIENPSGQKKLTKICLDITSSASFLIGSITSISLTSLFELPIAPFVSAPFFIFGYSIVVVNIVQCLIGMAINFVKWLTDSKPQTQKDEVSVDELQLESHHFSTTNSAAAGA